MVLNNTGVIVKVKNGIQVIKFSNKRKLNAIKVSAYGEIKKALEEAERDDNIKCTVLTGDGEYYCSGFEMSIDPGLTSELSPVDVFDQGMQAISAFIHALIDYPKLLVAVVNGPAIGIGVTTLGLCDIVYASDRATFTTPFAKLGLCAEGCSSYTFPRILGNSKAGEMLYAGHKMSAEEAHQFKLVSQVFPHDQLALAWKKIKTFTQLSANSIRISKEMVRRFDLDTLHRVNDMEMANVKRCFMSEDFGMALMQFMSKKSASKL